jgi:predicted alpha/beta hydrolase family esterase
VQGFCQAAVKRLFSLVLPPTIPDALLDAAVLMQAGWHNSGPNHWQSIWARKLGTRARRIAHDDWETPVRSRWIEEACAALDAEMKPVLFVAHSLGCVLAAMLGQIPSAAHQIKAAFLVAPADVERAGAPAELQDFGPIPRERLPFPAIVVASSDDPYCRLSRAQEFADAWGAEFKNIGNAGHIAGPPRHGPWPEGLEMLARLASGERVE